MDAKELGIVREKYGRMEDEELKQLLLAGKDEFEPEAFNLLVEEARKRQMELGAEIAASEKSEPPAQALERELEQENYAELIVCNDREDCDLIRRRLEGAGINFYFQPISYTGKELPLALLVQQSRAEEAIALLRDFSPRSSIVLW